MRPELQLILASAPLHTSKPHPNPLLEEREQEELQAIDTLIPVIEDWNKLALLLIDRGTAPLLYRKLPHLKNTELIPAQAQELLRKAYYKTVSRNARIYEEFKGLSAVLQAQNIPFITLKGICMSEWLYGDTGLRQMSDIDILIQEKDGVRCLDALHAAGYVSQKEFMVDAFVDAKSQNHFNPLFRNHVMVEIHIRLQNTREIYQQNLQEVWKDAVPVTLNGMETLRLELSDMLIHACLHLDKHFVTTHVQFTSFNDIVNLLRDIDNGLMTTDNGDRAKNKEQRIKTEEIENFWERFEAKCIVQGFTDTVFTYLVLVANYYKAPLPQHLVEKYDSLLNSEIKTRFENFLVGTENEFIRRGRTKTNIGAHIIHLQRLKNPIDFLRYVKGVVFPGKEFMISKYIESQEQRTKNQDGKKKLLIIRSALPLGFAKNSKLLIKYWWLWYPYRWYKGLKGLWYVITKNTLKRNER